MQALLNKIQKVTRTKKDLQHSLASSRHGTLANSRKTWRKGRSAPTRREPQPWGTTSRDASGNKEQRSEYSDTLHSLLKLKQGSSDYNAIVANAMEATDNLLTLKDAQGTSSQPVKPIQNKTVGKVGQLRKVAGDITMLMLFLA